MRTLTSAATVLVACLAWIVPAAAGDGNEMAAPRSLRVAVRVERDAARLVAFTLSPAPFRQSVEVAQSDEVPHPTRALLRLALLGKDGARFARELRVGPLCLEHAGGVEPHIHGDRVLAHSDTFVTQLPELAGYDRLEIAIGDDREERAFRVLEVAQLDRAHFDAAGRNVRFEDLKFAGASAEAPEPVPFTPGTVTWPESLGDPDVYLVYGNADELDKRTTIVLIPDGYTYGQKAQLQLHANQVVQYFRAKTPFKEHDPLVNYTLVYAYSTHAGPDQCDCGIVRDSAFSTYFPLWTPTCGHSANRCLYYSFGSACDFDSSSNLALAEMRAPGFDYGLGDRTIVMVNTTRYGGCGGVRAVYSAGNSSATEVAVHELGHSFAGLADEYGGNAECGSFASEVNTSRDPIDGAWPEWSPILGPPVEGADYYDQCVYRPQALCDMRSLSLPFCAVCAQQFALTFFEQPRVRPTAPIASASPAPGSLAAQSGSSAPFSVSTRFAVGPAVTNEIEWRVQGPNDTAPVVVASGVANVNLSFPDAGNYSISCRVIADTNFIRPERYGGNVDQVNWTVAATLAPPEEVSPPGSADPLRFVGPLTMSWEPAALSGSSAFNVYRGTVALLPSFQFGTCLELGVSGNSFDDKTPAPGEGECFTYLVAGVNGAGEGPLGLQSSGFERPNTSPCPP